jgi:hypothetical protein
MKNILDFVSHMRYNKGNKIAGGGFMKRNFYEGSYYEAAKTASTDQLWSNKERNDLENIGNSEGARSKECGEGRIFWIVGSSKRFYFHYSATGVNIAVCPCRI